ncbi:hypothetical protein NS202_05035 [Mammaliicoccus sciuri]|nr:hypothetical protein NS202_05035 [Mammaliicoccus sciuri]
MQIWKIYCYDWTVDYSEVRFLGRYFYLAACKSHFWTGKFFYRSIFPFSGPILPFQTNMKRMRQPTLSHPLILIIYLLIDLAILDTV